MTDKPITFRKEAFLYSYTPQEMLDLMGPGNEPKFTPESFVQDAQINGFLDKDVSTTTLSSLHNTLRNLFALEPQGVLSPDLVIDDNRELNHLSEAHHAVLLEGVRPFVEKSNETKTWLSASRQTAIALIRLLEFRSVVYADADPQETRASRAFAERIAETLQRLDFSSFRARGTDIVERWKDVAAIDVLPGDPTTSFSSSFWPTFLSYLTESNSKFSVADIDAVLIAVFSSHPEFVSDTLLLNIYHHLDEHTKELQTFLRSESTTAFLEVRFHPNKNQDVSERDNSLPLLAACARAGNPRALRTVTEMLQHAKHPLLSNSDGKPITLKNREFAELLCDLVEKKKELPFIGDDFREELRLYLPILFRQATTHAAQWLGLLVDASPSRANNIIRTLDAEYSIRRKTFLSTPHQLRFSDIARKENEKLKPLTFHNIYRAIMDDGMIEEGDSLLASLSEEGWVEAEHRLEDVATSGQWFSFFALSDLFRIFHFFHGEPAKEAKEFFRHRIDISPLLASSDYEGTICYIASILQNVVFLHNDEDMRASFNAIKLIAHQDGEGSHPAIATLALLAACPTAYKKEPEETLVEIVRDGYPAFDHAWKSWFPFFHDSYTKHDANFSERLNALVSIIESPRAGARAFLAAENLWWRMSDPEIKAKIATVKLHQVKHCIQQIDDTEEAYRMLIDYYLAGNPEALPILFNELRRGGTEVFSAFKKFISPDENQDGRGLAELDVELAQQFRKNQKGFPEMFWIVLGNRLAERGYYELYHRVGDRTVVEPAAIEHEALEAQGVNEELPEKVVRIGNTDRPPEKNRQNHSVRTRLTLPTDLPPPSTPEEADLQGVANAINSYSWDALIQIPNAPQILRSLITDVSRSDEFWQKALAALIDFAEGNLLPISTDNANAAALDQLINEDCLFLSTQRANNLGYNRGLHILLAIQNYPNISKTWSDKAQHVFDSSY
ncbi:MAG: hypothetical protein HY540_01490 [Deltaproteobacteria bacterium]|nr:hypothetical protein [Deltaproteobacteria bacterium]